MKMFDLEKAIQEWKRNLFKNPGLEERYIIELEEGLRDEIDDLVGEGQSKEEAFRRVILEMAPADVLGAEFYKVRTKRRSGRPPWQAPRFMPALLWNYFKVALRKIKRQKSYSFINIGGLVVGFTCSFLIVVFVQHELCYDRFNTKVHHIYRVLNSDSQSPDILSALSPSGWAPLLAKDFSSIKRTVRFFTNLGRADLKYGGESRTVQGLIFADGSVFNVFDYPFQAGNPSQALRPPNTIVLTARAAAAWFDKENPIDKIITYLRGTQKIPLRITGVINNIPSTSHLKFDYIVSFPTIREFMGKDALSNFTSYNYYTYVLLEESVEKEQIEEGFPQFITKNFDEDTAENLSLHLQPLSNIHLNNTIRWNIAGTGNPQYLYVFSGVALVVLLIACFNFINLSTARAQMRAREVGVRKVVGAHRRQLISQLFGEFILTSLVATFFALILLGLFVQKFGVLVGQDLSINFFNNPDVLLLLFGIGLAVGSAAGIYPAIVLTAFNVTTVLKGTTTKGKRGTSLRKGLIVTQFTLSILLLVSIIVVHNQIVHMKNVPLGFDKEQVVILPMTGTVKSHFDVFRDRLISHSVVQNVTLSTVPGRIMTSSGYNWPGKEGEEGEGFYSMFADPYTLETLGIELIEGRNFSDRIATDEKSTYILNEAAVKQIGWDKTIGQPFRVWDEEMGQVIGVVKDFHFKSLHQTIEPLVIYYKTDWSWSAAVRFNTAYIASAIQTMEEAWREFEPDIPFSYTFLDKDFDRHYRSEERLGHLLGAFTFLAMFIACLGLLGLAAFSIQIRMKEIGIRKVLGASVLEILRLFSMEFLKLVLFAFILAVPLGFWLMHSWLQNFAYRISVGFLPFLVSGLTTLLIALLTVCSQITRAAQSNPADIMRYE
jgi:putative ABC transport system permease protein